MPDQNQTQTPAPTQTPPPAATGEPAANQTQGAPAPKKSNAAVIVIVIILVVLVVLGVGGYLAFRYAKNKVNKTLNSVTSSTSSTSSSGTAQNTANSVADTFNAAKDTAPTSGLGLEINSELKTILTGVFGGAKISEWMDLGDGTVLTYTVKRLITTDDFAKVETAFVSKGWVKSSNYNTDSDFSIDFTKSGKDLRTSGTVGEQRVSATVSQVTQ